MSALTASTATAIFVVAGFYYSTLVHSLPVLTDARGFIYFAGWIERFSVFEFLLSPEGYSDWRGKRRLVSNVVFAGERLFCGFDAPCINLVQIGLMAITSAVLFLHVVQVSKNIKLGVISSLLWIFSAPALNAVFWQATQHHKLAALFSGATLCASFHAVTNPSRNTGKIIFSNLGVWILSVLALNSKEVSFFLPAALVAQVAVFAPSRSWAGYLEAGRMVVLPIVYCTYFISMFFSRISPDWLQHVGSGDHVSGLITLLGFFMNVGNLMSLGIQARRAALLSWIAVLGLAATVGAAAIGYCICRRKAASYQPASDRANGLRMKSLGYVGYFLVIGASTLTLMLRTKYPSAYYLLIPAWALQVALLGTVDAVLQCVFARGKATAGFLLGACTLPFLLGYASQLLDGAAVIRLRKLGANFSESFATIQTAVPAPMIHKARFVFDEEPDCFWYFFRSMTGEGGDQELLPFVYQKNISVPLTYDVGRISSPYPEQGELLVHWTPDLRIARIALGGTEVFRRTRKNQ